MWGCETKDEPPSRIDLASRPLKDPVDALAPIAKRPGLCLPIPDNLVMMLSGEMPRIKECVKQTIATGRPISSFQPVLLAVLEHLTIKPSDVIADIGGGSGVLEISLLEKGIPFAKAYVVDIDEPSLELLTFMLDQTAYEGREKIVPVVSSLTDVKLPPNTIDLAVFVRANFIDSVVGADGKVHGAPDTITLLKTVANALKPDGRVEFFFMKQARNVSVDGKSVDFGDDAVSVPFVEAGMRFISRSAYKVPGGGPYEHFSFVKDANATANP